MSAPKPPVTSQVARAKVLTLNYQLVGGANDEWIMTPIWRYMTFEKFCWLIEKSDLVHSRLDCFEDPFEGAITKVAAKQRAVENPGLSTSRSSEVRQLHRMYWYASCWHSSHDESAALWKLYAPGGAGVAIKSLPHLLGSSVTPPEGSQACLSPVEYIDFARDGMRFKTGGRSDIPFGCAKRKAFAHEKEVRALLYFQSDASGRTNSLEECLERVKNEGPSVLSARADLKEMLLEIVVSPLAPSYVEELVRIVSRRVGLEKLVRKSELCEQPTF